MQQKFLLHKPITSNFIVTSCINYCNDSNIIAMVFFPTINIFFLVVVQYDMQQQHSHHLFWFNNGQSSSSSLACPPCREPLGYNTTLNKLLVMFIWEFINSISVVNSRLPLVSGWWSTVQLYLDKTGTNISRTVRLGQEKNDRFNSHGKSLMCLAIQRVIKSPVTAKLKPLPVNARSGLYLLFTFDDVVVQDFCGQVCGFHYFTLPSIVGYTLPFAWMGNSKKLCPGVCAYPFAVPN